MLLVLTFFFSVCTHKVCIESYRLLTLTSDFDMTIIDSIVLFMFTLFLRCHSMHAKQYHSVNEFCPTIILSSHNIILYY